MDTAAIALSARLSALTTLVLVVVGLPIAWWLTTSRFRGKFLVEAVVALPLVLPPTVLGFYLLTAFGPRSGAGRLFEAVAGHPFPFSFVGLLVASILYSLPFAVQPFAAALAGAVLTFAHTLGEFGVVLMVGGNIPGKTRTMSVAIFDHVEALEYRAAHLTAGLLLLVSFLVLSLVYALQRRPFFRWNER